jgi:ABC-type molybdate transport system substrate-binding protein
VSHISRYNERGMGRLLIILLAMATICGQTVRARELSIAAASDLVFCLEELNRAFNKSHPEIVLKLITGASGNLFAQISNGAPFDVFLSADMRYPLELIKAGLASPNLSPSTPSDISSSGPQVTLWIFPPAFNHSLPREFGR